MLNVEPYTKLLIIMYYYIYDNYNMLVITTHQTNVRENPGQEKSWSGKSPGQF